MSTKLPSLVVPRYSDSDYQLEREQWVPATMDRVFEFFADAHNLEAITPPWLNIRILNSEAIQMGMGAEIFYRIRITGVPVRWKTQITDWKPGTGFVDVQEYGPYALWEHTHRFMPLGDGVLMTDVVRYRLPLGPLGRLAHGLWVGRALAAIFDYRFRRIREIFAAPNNG